MSGATIGDITFLDEATPRSTNPATWWSRAPRSLPAIGEILSAAELVLDTWRSANGAE